MSSGVRVFAVLNAYFLSRLLKQPKGELQGFLGLSIALGRWFNGLKRKTVEVDGYIIPYLEGGSGETLVLVHGFSGELKIALPNIVLA